MVGDEREVDNRRQVYLVENIVEAKRRGRKSVDAGGRLLE